MDETFYNILGVPKTATSVEIKKAYRLLSFKYHPDSNKGSTENINNFHKINEAYEILGESDSRKKYDSQINNPFIRMDTHVSQFNENSMEHLFNNIFGKMQEVNIDNINIPQNIPIPINDFFKTMNEVPIMPSIIQQTQKPTPIIKTITIQIEQILEDTNIPIDIERWLIENNTKIFEKETIYVDIPKGIDNNEIIIIRNRGNILNELIKGDIKLFIKIENNTQYERKGMDLYMNKTITLKESLCGFTCQLNHINGKTYTINNIKGIIITPNYKKIIPNLGLCRNNNTGNLIIIISIEFPTELSDDVIQKLQDIL